MYRELISRWIEHHDWAKLQPPCSEEELQKAERYVGYAFPEELKELLRETNGDRWLLLSAKQIMEHVDSNRSVWPEYLEPEEFLEKVDRHIFFATNGCGDYYCYRILPNGVIDTSAIYLWEHENFEVQVVARDLPDLISKYYNNEI